MAVILNLDEIDEVSLINGYFMIQTVGKTYKISYTDLNSYISGADTSAFLAKVTYDPNNVSSDVFDMDNMVEGATTKILTATERAAIVTNTAKVSNVAHPLVETAVPLGAVFTDTVYDDAAIQAEVDLNTAKVSNVSTNLSVGATTATSLDINSSDGTNATIPQAIATTSAGLLSGSDKDKLDNIEAGSDITDTANVTAAGALMDSEVTNLAAVKTFDPTVYAAALGIDDNYVTDAEKVILGNTSGSNSGDQDLSGLQPKPSEGQFIDGDKSKLDSIESNATADQTGAEIKSSYEAELNTNAFTDTEKTLLGNQSGVNTGDQDLSPYTTRDGVEIFTNKTLDSFTNLVKADDIHFRIRNESGVLITKGSPVYASGYNIGQNLVQVDLADASTESTAFCIGLVEEDIANSATGGCVSIGLLNDVDTSAFILGDILYVSETAGELTNVYPSGSSFVQSIGEVLRVNANNGVIDISMSQTRKTGFIQSLLDSLTALAARNILELGTLATQDGSFSGSSSGTNTGDQDLSGLQPKPSEGQFVDGDKTKLDGIETSATADQTGSEIKLAYEAELDTNAFTDAEKTKLTGIEALADVTDTANVTAAGALMDSEVTNLAQVKAFDSSAYATAAQGATADAAVQPATLADYLPIAGGTLAGGLNAPYFEAGVGGTVGGEFGNFDSITDRSGGTPTFPSGIKATGGGVLNLPTTAGTLALTSDLSGYQLQPSEGQFVDGDKTKLDGIETGADVTDSANVKTAIPLGYTLPQTLTDGATVAYDVSLGVQASWTIAGDRTLSNITNAAAGQSGTLVVTQDATGGRAITLDTGYTVIGGDIANIAAMAASEIAVIGWYANTASSFLLWVEVQA